MKKEEVRIGNYYQEFEGTIDNYGVGQICPKDFAYVCEAGGDFSDYGFEPIPLTEEWLLKFGVKWKTVIGDTRLRKFIDNFEIPDWIEYVHDFQNWYYYKFEKRELQFIKPTPQDPTARPS